MLSEVEIVGRNSNTVVREVTTIAELTEKMKIDLQVLVEQWTKMLNSFLEKNAEN